MSEDNLTATTQDINKLIIQKLQSYPDAVSKIAIRIIELSDLPEATLYEQLQQLVRQAAHKQGG